MKANIKIDEWLKHLTRSKDRDFIQTTGYV